MTPYQLQKCGINNYQSLIAQIGFAYHWAQRVCGMDFLTKQVSFSLSFNSFLYQLYFIQMNNEQVGRANVENVIKILLQRLQIRFDLATQLQQLGKFNESYICFVAIYVYFTESNIIPKIPKDSNFSTNRISALAKWSSSTYQTFCQSKCTQYLVDEDIPTPSDLFYTAMFERGSGEF